MISLLKLKDFRCFDSLDLQLGMLNLLVGANSSGKSSVLQSLLLAQAACGELREERRRVSLNSGPLCLGSFDDAVSERASQRAFEILISAGRARLKLRFEKDEDSPFEAKLTAASARTTLVRKLERLVVIPADRDGPREVYSADEPDYSFATISAEALVGKLAREGTQRVAHLLASLMPDSPPTLIHQVNAWLNELFPGIRVDPALVPRTNLMSLGIRSSSGGNVHRALNVGHGISYCLPIVVGLLSSSPGEVFAVENPEAHLNPRAQSRLCRLLVAAAHFGVQVIVETHSEHFLNWVRLSIVRQEIAHNLVRVIMFGSEPHSGRSSATIVPIDADGRFVGRPVGMLDEAETQTLAILKERARR